MWWRLTVGMESIKLFIRNKPIKLHYAKSGKWFWRYSWIEVILIIKQWKQSSNKWINKRNRSKLLWKKQFHGKLLNIVRKWIINKSAQLLINSSYQY